MLTASTQPIVAVTCQNGSTTVTGETGFQFESSKYPIQNRNPLFVFRVVQNPAQHDPDQIGREAGIRLHVMLAKVVVCLEKVRSVTKENSENDVMSDARLSASTYGRLYIRVAGKSLMVNTATFAASNATSVTPAKTRPERLHRHRG